MSAAADGKPFKETRDTGGLPGLDWISFGGPEPNSV